MPINLNKLLMNLLYIGLNQGWVCIALTPRRDILYMYHTLMWYILIYSFCWENVQVINQSFLYLAYPLNYLWKIMHFFKKITTRWKELNIAQYVPNFRSLSCGWPRLQIRAGPLAPARCVRLRLVNWVDVFNVGGLLTLCNPKKHLYIFHFYSIFYLSPESERCFRRH